MEINDDKHSIFSLDKWKSGFDEEERESEFESWPKYQIFLPDVVDKCKFCCCCSKDKRKIDNRLFNKLRTCGFSVYYEREKIQYRGVYNDNQQPDVNVIYIRLTKDKYYSDTIFPQKKAELEREILLLLTGILGGHKITCNSNISQSELYSMNQALHISGIEESVELKHRKSEVDNIKREEIYENTGSEILIESNIRSEVNGWDYMLREISNIFKIIERTSIASYDYFIRNSDLYTFVFKRYLLNLTNYVYRIEEDRTLEKSVQARLILQKYGLSTKLDSKYTTSKTHEYIIEFYNMNELEDYTEIKRMERKNDKESTIDIFSKLRRQYELNNIIMKKIWPDWGGDEKPMYAEVVRYSHKIDAYEKLVEWKKKEDNDFNKACHGFKSKLDVDIWFSDTIGIEIKLDKSMDFY